MIMFKKGFITLLAVLVIGAIGLVVATSLLLLGLGSLRTSFAIEQSKQTRSLADACAEEALRRIRESTPFTGSVILNLGQGSCSYTVVSTGGQNRTITATGTVDNNIRKVRVTINKINPTINTTSWEELASF